MSGPNIKPNYFSSERLSRKEKEANNFQWYREKADMYDSKANSSPVYNGIDDRKRMKVNYDLFNNIVDPEEFEYVCKPFGAEAGELPATMVNRDISSYRIKAVLGMEMKRPFGYRLMAVNREAGNRKTDEEASRIQKYVVDSIMAPIRHQKEVEYQEKVNGKTLTPDEKTNLMNQMQAEIDAATPDKVRAYMKRDHRDPSEVQGQQIMNYLTKKEDLKRKMTKGWKHATLSAYEIYWMGIINGEPVLKVINPMRFRCDKPSDLEFIENGEWACAEFMMPPSEVIQTFEMTDKEIDQVWREYADNRASVAHANAFDFSKRSVEYDEDSNCVRVAHFVWRGLRQVGWLDYIDSDGVLQTKFLVDESYVLNKKAGDVSISWEWIPEIYQTFKICTDIYKEMGPIPGQIKDPQNIKRAPLPYYGAIYDNLNSQPTSIMDRMKVYQYYYNIVMYRLELLLASDKGKKILMNINAIPETDGMDIKKWQYFFESTPFMWYNPDEEGMNQQDVNTIAKTLDLSLASDIQRYIDLAEYLDQKCGKSVGITDPVLGQTAVSERVGNNQQNLVQTSYMLEPYFETHAAVRRNVYQGLIDLARVAYVNSDKKFLAYVLDDMSQELFNIDTELLSESVLGLFVEDSAMSEEINETIKQLAHAAMQNQKIELSDVLKVIKQTSIQEAEEALLVSEDLRTKREQDMEAQKAKNAEKLEEKQQAHEKEKWGHEADMIVLKATEDRKTKIQEQTIMSMGFNEDKDMDSDGIPDVLELAKHGVDAQIKMAQEDRENRKLDHQISNDTVVNKLKSKELDIKAKQAAKPASKSK